MSEAYLESPYLDDPRAVWLRGNLHTHTTRSDGAGSPQEMIAAFASRGYGFLGFSDHDVCADLSGLDARGMLLLPGAELSGGPHMLAVGARELPPPSPAQQDMIDAVNRQDAFVVLCHPNWEEDYDHYPFPLMLSLNGYAGIEIFNGVVRDLPGSHLATDKWDRLLAAGRKVWGFANDDCHALGQVGRGWNVVRVPRPAASSAEPATPEAVLSALRAGSFYASSGVQIESIRCAGPVLHLAAGNADRMVIYGRLGACLGVVDGPTMAFDASEVDSPHIRVECLGRGGASAWTQPFFIRNGRHERFQRRLAELGALEKSRLQVLRAERAPNLSGRADDPLWRQAPAFDRFLRMQDGEVPPVATELRAILAGDTLFLAARCREPDPDHMRLTADADGIGNIWTNDSMEFFLDVEGKGLRCYQIIVNADGHTYCAPRGQGLRGNVRLTARAARLTGPDAADGGWCVELALPLGQLGVRPRAGERWGFHVCRNRYPVRGTFVWSWVGPSNHNVREYGSLIF